MIHLDGFPVSEGTYVNAGCRCQGCRDANAAAQRARRRKGARPSEKAYRLATNSAAKWVRHRHPEQWARMLRAAYRDLGHRMDDQ